MHAAYLFSQAKLESDTLSCDLKAAAAGKASGVLGKGCPKGTWILPLALSNLQFTPLFAVNYDLKLLNHAKCHLKSPFILSVSSIRVWQGSTTVPFPGLIMWDAEIQGQSEGDFSSAALPLDNPLQGVLKGSRELCIMLWAWAHDERCSKKVNCKVNVLYTHVLKNK